MLLFIAAAVAVWATDSAVPAQAQDGEDECGPGPCPDWIVEDWSGSGHADITAEAFIHWDEETPAEVPTSCAKCHSEGGYLDYLGADGTEAGVVDNAAPIGTTVTCTVCHNPVAIDMTSVTFPSGVELTDLDSSARCMQCHQGRSSGVQVNEAITEVGLDLDESSEELGFINIHYFAAAASLFGSEVHGGYEFEGHAYDGKFRHVPEYDTCAACHSPHTLEVKVTECAACHDGITSTEDLRSIRMPGSLVDYDGDGDIEEGIYDEVDGLHAMLYQAIQAYAKEVVGTPIVYDTNTHPYFFIDTNDNGAVDEGEAAGENAYASFSPRLLMAAYNYQMFQKDPGAFAHNAKYHIQLHYDSIEMLNEALATPIDLSQAHRTDAGHFDATVEAFRHWDAEGEVPASCTKCHSAEGLPFLLEHDVTISFEPSAGLACSTCHANFEDFSVHEIAEVPFPSGAVLGFEDNPAANLCLECHQGRESSVSVEAAIVQAGVGPDEVSDQLRFRNSHYFTAGATLFGSEAQGIYQYEGKEYAGPLTHVPNYTSCTQCHNTHQLTVRFDECATCHAGIESVDDIRMMAEDYDGDGVDEGIAGEIETLHEELLVLIQGYAANTAGTPIAYSSASYPYWFTDTNANGTVDPEEANSDNGFTAWTPNLLRAAYNYQYVAKDPGAFAHNGKYVAQVLYDSLESMGGEEAVAGKARP
jgi:hypothetical protein